MKENDKVTSKPEKGYKWKNVFEKISMKNIDEVSGKVMYNVDIKIAKETLAALKSYKSVFSMTGQNSALWKCKKSIRNVNLALKCCYKGLNKFVFLDDDKKDVKSITKYDRLLPNSVLEKINKHYFLFEQFYIETTENCCILVGALPSSLAVESIYLYTCIDIFKNEEEFEMDLASSKKLYKSLRVKAFLKEHWGIVVFIVVIAICLFFLMF